MEESFNEAFLCCYMCSWNYTIHDHENTKTMQKTGKKKKNPQKTVLVNFPWGDVHAWTSCCTSMFTLSYVDHVTNKKHCLFFWKSSHILGRINYTDWICTFEWKIHECATKMSMHKCLLTAAKAALSLPL